MSKVTHILAAIERGDAAAEQLLPLVYDELRKLAAQKLAHEKPGQTLDATGLVHEAYLRLVTPPTPPSQGGEELGSPPCEAQSSSPPCEGCAGAVAFANSRHFFAAAAEAMRRILVDRARARLALKRGGHGARLAVDLDALTGRYSDAEMIDTDAVLDALAADDADAAEVVRLHVFAGLSIGEAGQALGMGRSTAYRNWDYARAWLREALGKGKSEIRKPKSETNPKQSK